MDQTMKRWMLRGGSTALAVALLVCFMLLHSCRNQPSEPTEPPTTQYTLPPSAYTPEDFVFDGDYLSCTAGETVLGIDVSSHQGEIDWQQVAGAGVEFVFVRLAYRGYSSGTLNPDEYARINLDGAREAGIAVGAYLYSQAVSVAEAEEEARYALEMLDGFQLDLPLVYDWEYVSDTARTANVDARNLTDCTLAFCEAVEEAGCEAMIYFNSSQIMDLLYGGELEQYPWWLAKYDLAMEFPCQADLWQYTNQGTVPGITGVVDIDLMFTDYGLGQVFAQVP